MAVADGVSAWAEQGRTAAHYARKLMTNILKYFPEDQHNYQKNPKNLFIKVAEKNDEIGTSTCVILTINPDTNNLMVVNMGDSGFV